MVKKFHTELVSNPLLDGLQSNRQNNRKGRVPLDSDGCKNNKRNNSKHSNNEFIVDTNILLDHPRIVEDENCIILACVLQELEAHKTHRDRDLRYKAREACRCILENMHSIKFDMNDYECEQHKTWQKNHVDNEIIQACIDNKYSLMTYDLYLQIKARNCDINTIDAPKQSMHIYAGYIKIEMSDAQLATLYRTMQPPSIEMYTNQYLLVKQGDECIDKLRWNGKELVQLKYRSINKVKPINTEQHLLFDMLQNQDITVKSCTGALGSGKDYIMLTHALSLVDSGRFDKIVWARNNIGTKGVPPIGFLPGDLAEKSEPFLAPLIDHVGMDQYRSLLTQGKLELQHLSTIRGREIKNSIIYVTEAQNTTRQLLRLILSRVGVGSQLWVNGDVAQVDANVFEDNCGLTALQDLKGDSLYGQVNLVDIERSDTAKLARLL